MPLRSPIVSVLGHVDHGKSSILDAIRESNIVATEAGRITQAIGASIIPLDVIKKRCGPLLKPGATFSIPGLLFIDTPGHAAFTSLRKRGGSLADIAILVVDINEGFKPQTLEAAEILKAYKTPFVVAANKVDLAHGYRKQHDRVLQDIEAQNEQAKQYIDNAIYRIVGELYEKLGLQSERFDRVEDYTKQLAIVPCSAINKHGIPELLMVLAGLAQKYLENRLHMDAATAGRGTILEVKETQGLGITADVILYDGTLKRGDTIVIAGTDEPITTKIRALLEPAPLAEMRDKKAKFKPVNEAVAATGIKIAAPDLDKAIPGMPLMSANGAQEIEDAKRKLQQELESLTVKTQEQGIVIRADTIGSLEALSKLLADGGIPVRAASVGPISRKDVADAEANFEKDPLTCAILAFNLPDFPGSERVKVFTSPVIYTLIDDYKAWRDERRKQQQRDAIEDLTPLCRLEILQNCIFRQSNPAIVGIEVLQGTLKPRTPIMKADGTRLTTINELQQEQKNLHRADRGFQLAISLPHVVCGRHINEHDILLTDLDENGFRAYKQYRDLLSAEQKDILKAIAELRRKQNPVWGV